MMNTAPWPVQEIGLGSINPANTGEIIHSSSSSCSSKQMLERKARTSNKEQPLSCPRCSSTNTKFCYYNNYSASQPRHFCKNCKRYWTEGGSLRNVPVGGSSRKNKKQIPKKMTDSAATNSLDSSILTHTGDVGKGSHFENLEDVLENHAGGLPFDLLRSSGDLSKCHNSSLSSLSLLRNGSSCSVSNLSSFLPNNQYSDAELGFNGVSAAALTGFGNFQGVSEETGRLSFGLQGLRHESVLGFEESAGNHGEPFGYWSDVLQGAFCWNHNTTNYGP